MFFQNMVIMLQQTFLRINLKQINLIVFKATPKLSSIEKKLKIKYNKIFIIANCIPIAITEERVPIFFT